MRFGVRSLGLVLAGALACAGPGPVGPPPPPPGEPEPLPVYRVDPSDITLVAGATLQLTLRDEAGGAIQATWTLADTALATISPEGLLRTCSGYGTIVARAVPLATPVRQIEGRLQMVDRSLAVVYVRRISRASDGAPADLTALADVVDIELGVDQGRLICGRLRDVRLDLVDTSGNEVQQLGETPLSADQPPTVTFRWNSTSAPNGLYHLRPRLKLQSLSVLAGPNLPLRVQNP